MTDRKNPPTHSGAGKPRARTCRITCKEAAALRKLYSSHGRFIRDGGIQNPHSASAGGCAPSATEAASGATVRLAPRGLGKTMLLSAASDQAVACWGRTYAFPGLQVHANQVGETVVVRLDCLHPSVEVVIKCGKDEGPPPHAAIQVLHPGPLRPLAGTVVPLRTRAANDPVSPVRAAHRDRATWPAARRCVLDGRMTRRDGSPAFPPTGPRRRRRVPAACLRSTA